MEHSNIAQKYSTAIQSAPALPPPPPPPGSGSSVNQHDLQTTMPPNNNQQLAPEASLPPPLQTSVATAGPHAKRNSADSSHTAAPPQHSHSNPETPTAGSGPSHLPNVPDQHLQQPTEDYQQTGSANTAGQPSANPNNLALANFGFPSFSIASDIPSEDRERLKYTRSFKPETPGEILYSQRWIILGFFLILTVLGTGLMLAAMHDTDGKSTPVQEEIDERVAKFGEDIVPRLQRTSIVNVSAREFAAYLEPVDYYLLEEIAEGAVGSEVNTTSSRSNATTTTIEDSHSAHRHTFLDYLFKGTVPASTASSNWLHLPIHVTMKQRIKPGALGGGKGEDDTGGDGLVGVTRVDMFDLPPIPIITSKARVVASDPQSLLGSTLSTTEPMRLKRACFELQYPVVYGYEKDQNTPMENWGFEEGTEIHSCFHPFNWWNQEYEPIATFDDTDAANSNHTVEVVLRAAGDPYMYLQELSKGTMKIERSTKVGNADDATPRNVVIAGVVCLVLGLSGTLLFIFFMFWIEMRPKRGLEEPHLQSRRTPRSPRPARSSRNSTANGSPTSPNGKGLVGNASVHGGSSMSVRNSPARIDSSKSNSTGGADGSNSFKTNSSTPAKANTPQSSGGGVYLSYGTILHNRRMSDSVAAAREATAAREAAAAAAGLPPPLITTTSTGGVHSTPASSGSFQQQSQSNSFSKTQMSQGQAASGSHSSAFPAAAAAAGPPLTKSEKRELKSLSKTLKEWRKAFKSTQGRKPTKQEVLHDGVMGPVYQRFKTLADRDGDDDSEKSD